MRNQNPNQDLTLKQAVTLIQEGYGIELQQNSLKKAAQSGRLKAKNTAPGSNRGEWLTDRESIDEFLLSSRKLAPKFKLLPASLRFAVSQSDAAYQRLEEARKSEQGIEEAETAYFESQKAQFKAWEKHDPLCTEQEREELARLDAETRRKQQEKREQSQR